VDWRAEARNALVVTLYVALFGSVVGVVWHAIAPRLDVDRVLHGSEAAMKPLIGDDVWLGVLGCLAAVICVAALIAVSPNTARGPGAQVGLVVGGILAMLVADRVGHLIGHGAFVATVRNEYPTGTPARSIDYVAGLLDLKARATAVLFTWPVVSVVLNVLIVAMQRPNQPTRLRVSTYPGSS
jgi:hypothetical protein